jgi:transposase-like protein
MAPRIVRAGLLEAAEEELLAFHSFPRERWPKLRSTSPLERVNRTSAATPTWPESIPTTER